MIHYNSTVGLSYDDIREIIDKELDRNADLLIGIDDPEVQEMINVLADAFSKAIEKNNERISRDLNQSSQL
jgi:hypothetical protein